MTDGASLSPVQEIDALLDAIADGAIPAGLSARISALIESDPDALDRLYERRDDLDLHLDIALAERAQANASLASLCLLLYKPTDDQPTAETRFARHGGPAGEIALAALYLIGHAGEVVTFDTADGPLEEATDPDFSDMRRVFGAAVSHLATAAYYVLDAADARQALLSSPPEQETFPPLPFPRVWVEMSHLTPLVRLTRNDAPPKTLDLIGVGIAEVEQGRIWDIYLPFRFDDDTDFFFLAGRISPNALIAGASNGISQGAGEASFGVIREIAVGAVHLMTARNAPPDLVTIPRHQRKRLPPRPDGSSLRLYYVDLHAAGESHPLGVGGRAYSVRWLVRGHWRHVPAGRSFCTCCDPPQIASWVTPYIKGPPGAPWKGKQVHRKPELS